MAPRSLAAACQSVGETYSLHTRFALKPEAVVPDAGIFFKTWSSRGQREIQNTKRRMQQYT